MESEIEFTRYRERFAAFCTITDEFSNVLKWLKHNQRMLGFDEAKTVISIGAGTGSFDLELVPLLSSLERYTVVEPNTLHLQEFIKSCDHDRRFLFRKQFFEDFLIDQEYDLGIVSHSLYYIKNYLKEIQRLTIACKNVLVFHQSNHGIHALQQAFGDLQTRKAMLSSDNIIEGLDRISLPYKKVRIDSHIDVTNVSDSVLDFIMERENTPQDRESIRSYLKDQCPNNLLYHPVDVIWLNEAFQEPS